MVNPVRFGRAVLFVLLVGTVFSGAGMAQLMPPPPQMPPIPQGPPMPTMPQGTQIPQGPPMFEEGTLSFGWRIYGAERWVSVV